MIRRDDGGPAFARPATDESVSQTGMSLRDWFAGQALAGLVSNVPGPVVHQLGGPEAFARLSALAAYSLADAMLAERRRPAAPPAAEEGGDS